MTSRNDEGEQQHTSTITWLDGKQSSAQAVLRLSPDDNVAVALRTLKAGESINDGSTASTTPLINCAERIMKGHKVALCDLPAGSRVIKYAQLIGVASADISAGDHVHTHNLAFTANDVSSTSRQDIQPLEVECTDSFAGYQRADGRVGTRNYIAVLSSVNCSATVAHRIADHFNEEILSTYKNVDGVAAFTHGTGCGMDDAGEGFANLQRVLSGYATHPNVGAVLIVGLGCETSQIAGTLKAYRLSDGPLLKTMNLSLIHI